jgi:hypothetical protein
VKLNKYYGDGGRFYGDLGKYYNFKRARRIWFVGIPSIVLGSWLFCFCLPWFQFVPPGSLAANYVRGQLTRAEILEIARSYAEHSWEATDANVMHGWDSSALRVDTPNTDHPQTEPDKWHIGPGNIGIPYKVSGFDTPESFDPAVQLGYAAGDTAEKGGRGNPQDHRRPSASAVGVDEAGFVSRCWKLPQRFPIEKLPGLCRKLKSTDDLEAGDILADGLQGIFLFDHWSDTTRSKAIFYVADPDTKVSKGEYRIFWLRLLGARPYRYLGIKDQ